MTSAYGLRTDDYDLLKTKTSQSLQPSARFIRLVSIRKRVVSFDCQNVNLVTERRNIVLLLLYIFITIAMNN